ncbi:MAG TPA: MJ0042-type zinc finger domain-containing protein [Pseudolabrys sp.]|nr:MJ0042-type zinc finger domain-containing protein [Pseudolabrys sp.]
MLIACPDCSTSYMIDPASLGEAGRTVRCARCRATWFADAAKPETVTAAEAEDAEPSPGVLRPDHMPDGPGAEVEISQTGEPATEPLESTANPDASTEAPEVVTDAPPIAPEMDTLAPADGPAGAETNEIQNFTTRRKRLQAKRKKERRSSRWTALVLVLLAFNVALVGARSEVVKFLPQTASLFSAIGMPVNLRHLKFENMRISKETQEGLSSLVIEGTIVSISNRPTEVPRLRFAARDTSGQEIYTWTAMPGRSILGPGEKLDFRSRFVSPPPNATDVMVRFLTPQDETPPSK